MRVRDLAADSRFPSYGPRAVQMGARSTLSLPLSSDGSVVGALNLYSRQVDAFDIVGDALAAADALVDNYQVYGIRNIVNNPQSLQQITADLDRKLGL